MPLRGLVLLALVSFAVACVSTTSGNGVAASGDGARVSRRGLTVLLPPHWHVVNRKLTPCVDPSERLTLTGRGALLMLQERLRPVAGDFPARPSMFSLRGLPELIECCAPLSRRGWLFRFGENGRGFYAYVYLGMRGTRAEALTILDSLRVAAREARQPT